MKTTKLSTFNSEAKNCGDTDHHHHTLLEKIASSSVLEEAYRWLCKRRKDAHYNNDVWHLQFHWKKIKLEMQEQLRDGVYKFSPYKSLAIKGKSIGQWCARDALLLKAMTIVLTEKLSPKISKDCVHLAGRGGGKGCVATLKKQISNYRFVCRSDVNSYYATIDHKLLLNRLREHIKEGPIVGLLINILDRVDNVNGRLLSVDRGITKGNPLSPLLGGLYLQELDRIIGDYCRKHGLLYKRFMDDWIILCKKRGQLRHVVRLMNQVLERVKMTKHPFKTYIGRIKDKGFDFLGYSILKEKLKPVAMTWANHQDRLLQLYERGASQECIGAYVKRWIQWLRSGVEIDIKEAISGLPLKVTSAKQWYTAVLGNKTLDGSRMEPITPKSGVIGSLKC